MSKISNSREYIAYPWPEYQEYMGEDWFLNESFYCAKEDVYFMPKRKMQVYIITPTKRYTGGCALVAATSVENAIEEFCKDNYYEYQYEELDCKCREIEGLTYIEKSCVIINTIYEE